MSNPVIAVTMGDGAGVGPEIVVAALLDPEIARSSSPVVIGDARRLHDAASVLGRYADLRYGGIGEERGISQRLDELARKVTPST